MAGLRVAVAAAASVVDFHDTTVGNLDTRLGIGLDAVDEDEPMRTPPGTSKSFGGYPRARRHERRFERLPGVVADREHLAVAP